KQKLPMRSEGNGPVAAHGGKEFFSILEIGGCQHAPVLRQPCHLAAVKRHSAFRPPGRISAPEEERQILHDLQRQVVPEDLERKNDDIDIVKEVKVDVRDIEENGRR